MQTINPALRANLSQIPTFTDAQRTDLAHALVESYKRNRAHTIVGIDRYADYHARFVQRQAHPTVSHFESQAPDSWPSESAFQQVAEAASGQYQAIYNKLIKPPFVIGVDTTFLYDTARARGTDIPAWDKQAAPGLDGWTAYQRQFDGTFNPEHLPPRGRGWQIMDQLLGLNRYAVDAKGNIPEFKYERVPLVRMVPVSRREPRVQLRIDNALQHDWQEHFDVGIREKSYGLNAGATARFAPGPIETLLKISPHLFFTASDYWAVKSLEAGINAFFVKDHKLNIITPDGIVSHSWDNDGVIIDGTSEEVFQRHPDWRVSLKEFNNHENINAGVLPNLGPAFAAFLGEYGLAHAFSHLPKEQRPFQIYKNTARGPDSTPRIMWAYKLWGIDDFTGTDFRSGEAKNPALEARGVSVHFEDGKSWADKAFDVDVIGALIFYGPKNQAEIKKILERGY